MKLSGSTPTALPQDLCDYHGYLWQYAREAAIDEPPSFPAAAADVEHFLANCGYSCSAALIEQAFGEPKTEFSLADFRQLHLRLEGWGCWKKFPNPTHDPKKSAEVLAIEVGHWLAGVEPIRRLEFVKSVSLGWLLSILAVARDPASQEWLLQAAFVKCGLEFENGSRWQ